MTLMSWGMDLPICAMAGDQQAALFGQACFEPGMVKSTYGTGCFALMNIGASFKVSENRLLTTVAFRMAGNITRLKGPFSWRVLLFNGCGIYADFLKIITNL